jgi:general secretion pathway protein G
LASHRDTDARGFTLTELLIVLAIAALVGALAVPPLSRLMDRWAFHLERSDLERQIDRLPQVARGEGHSIVLTSWPSNSPADPAYPVKVPRGWRLQATAPILYRFDGSCEGGELSISKGADAVRYVLAPPLCQLQSR